MQDSYPTRSRSAELAAGITHETYAPVNTRNGEYERVLSERAPGLDSINAPPPSLEERVAFALAFVDGVRPRLRLVQDEETYFRQWHCTDPFGDVVGRAWTADAAYAAWASRFAGLGGIRQPVSIP